MPLKIARELMEKGLVSDPHFDRDTEGMTHEDRRALDLERQKCRKLYQPDWVRNKQLWSPELKAAIEGGAFQIKSSDPTRGMGAVVKAEYIRVQKLFKSERYEEFTSPDNKYFHEHFLSDVPPHNIAADEPANLTPHDKLVRVLSITCMAKNVGTQKLTGGRWSRFVGKCPSQDAAADIVDATCNMPVKDLTKLTKEWKKRPGEWCQDVAPTLRSGNRGSSHSHNTTIGDSVGPLHSLDIEGDQFHWRCELRSSDWLTMSYVHGAVFTARELFSYYMSLPTIISSRTPDKFKRKREARLQSYVDIQIKSKDWAMSEGIKEPETREDYLCIIRKMGHKMATLRFMKNPKWMDMIPDCTTAEDGDTLWARAEYDDRITFPVSSLPMEVKRYFAKDSKGIQWAVAQVFYRCNCLVDVQDENYSKANKVWHQYECGLVHAAVSGFDYTNHKGTGSVHRYKCKACTGKWTGKKPGGRFLVIYDGTTVIQIILNEPSQSLLNNHLKERVRYFRKFEPRAVYRDTIPVIPKKNASVRIRATDPDMNALIWQTVLGEQDGSPIMDELQALAQAAVEENRDSVKGGVMIDTGVATYAARSQPPMKILSMGEFKTLDKENL